MENTSNTQHGERAEGWPALPMADDVVAFPTLDDSELAVLQALGSRRSVAVGEYLYREGDATYDFYVILSGAAEIVVRSDGEERIITRHGPGQFLGELNLLSGQRVYLSARVVEPGEVIVVPRAALHHLIATAPTLGDTILVAFLARRSALLSGASAAIRVVGSRFSPESLRVREFLARNGIPHEWLDPDRDAAVERLLREFAVTPGELPVVIVSGSVLRRPTPGGLAEYLGLTITSLPERCFDLVVVGAGPAGLAAAVYGASEGLQTLVVEMAAVGGQAGTSSRIENYLGFPTGISGGDLTQRAVVQAEKFGAHLTSPCTASSLREEAGHLVVRLSDGTDVAGRAVIVASGARYRRLDASRLADFEGNGVYYAATEMEARLCAGSPVVVAGGGNSAGQAALFLAAAGSPVTVVIRGHDLDASMSRYLVDRIEADARIEVRTNSKITGLDGDRTLTSVRVTTADGDTVFPCVALFSFIGADPAADWLSGCAALDARGFVLTDRSLGEEHLDGRWEALGRRPLPFETSYPGLFAVGDVRAGSTKRVAAAVGEGSAAVRSVHEYLAFAH
ncbi:MAG: cyclic nucleotide-binding domain-containing protein [Chloroflexi bacterium]|nr:MAG: cyclic nucleotide-binding domain-containing protein [Chloroflexota bacterium]